MTPAIDLTAPQRQTVLALLNRYLPNTTVWAYGSRVKRTSHPASDLDLVAFAGPEHAARVAELREAFDESNLPFRVDLFVWDDVPKSFRKRIKKEHVVLAKQEYGLSKGWLEVGTLDDLVIRISMGRPADVKPGEHEDLPPAGLVSGLENVDVRTP